MKNVMILIVLYQELLTNSRTMDAIKHSTINDLNVTIFDNSDIRDICLQNKILANKYGFNYVGKRKNMGLAEAYNYGSELTFSEGLCYLLLLDQDTKITESYLLSVDKAVSTMIDEDIVAIVPRVSEGNQIFEPVKINPLYCKSVVSAGVHSGIVTINSGTVLRNSFIRQIGGFNLEFSLDYLDHWLFYMIEANQKQVLVLPDVIQQSLSVHDMKSLSNSRYQNIIQAERKYIFEYRPKEKAKYFIHVMMRIGKLCLTGSFRKAFLNIKNLKDGAAYND